MKIDESYFKLFGNGEIPAEYASLVLKYISSAYHGLLILDLLSKQSKDVLYAVSYNLEYDIKYEVWTSSYLLEQNTDNSILSKLKQFETNSLELKGVVLQSPGFWEFIGKINPLEVIRQFLNDRHQRQKDREYLNKLEQERLSIENKILRTKLIKEVISSAKEAGVSESEIAKLIRDNAIVPLLRLESLQDSQLISYAKIANKKTIKEPEEIDA